MALATVACDLGAGRQVAADPIDFGVGLQLHVQVRMYCMVYGY